MAQIRLPGIMIAYLQPQRQKEIPSLSLGLGSRSSSSLSFAEFGFASGDKWRLVHVAHWAD
jgi:hypothetical protein